MSHPAPSPPRIVMLGPPGSGKGTHARLLAERLDIPHLSTGSMLRREIAAGSSLGLRVEATVNAGQLVDDAIIVDLVRSAIASLGANDGWILDGAPRSIEQATKLSDAFSALGIERVVAIALEVPEEVLRQRLLARGEREGRADDAPPPLRPVAQLHAPVRPRRPHGRGLVATAVSRVRLNVERILDFRFWIETVVQSKIQNRKSKIARWL